jgi:AcrR family transcriptional regulator
MSGPAYRRMPVDERRGRLLTLGADLFTRHSYDELSMADIARAAGVSKALLYHYFPSKRDFFRATLAGAAEAVRERTEPDPRLPPVEQLAASLGAFLELVDENEPAYRKIMQSATSVADVRELVDEIRGLTAARILAGLLPAPPAPAARIAVNGWLWFMDGACLAWLDQRDISRDQLRDLLLRALFGALGDRP